ncbi:hypothetical protein [Leifsonia xyli]|uniref:hypothetical protein n=1 Tax=Leifsonia xyli TaxID=1575 RepID=UPI001186F10F|nr:hypothetical protein [Leifsonia xyli]
MSKTVAVTPEVVAVPVYLTPEQVCDLVPGMTVRSLKEMRAARRAGVRGSKGGPVYVKPNAKTVVYDTADVVAYMNAIKGHEA